MHNQWSAAHKSLYVARNQLPAEGNYLPEPHNRLPRLGYWLPQTHDLMPPSGNHLPRLCSRLPVRSNGLVRMYDYLSRALYWWFPGLQKTFGGMVSPVTDPGTPFAERPRRSLSMHHRVT